MKREQFLSLFGAPCNKPPWGSLTAVDITNGEILWKSDLGTSEDFIPIIKLSGTPNAGGPVVTASGLVFIGAAMDNYLRVFDIDNGNELWKGRLPAGPQATPMTYMFKGKQYVVIASGGHSRFGTTPGDSVVAFVLHDQ